MTGDRMKMALTVLLLFATLGWAAYSVETIKEAMRAPSSLDILAVAGVAGVTGALTTLLTLAVQFWFRKRPKNLDKGG